MVKGNGREVAVGTLFALALVILALGIMAIGGESSFLSRKARYFVVTPSADGLALGSPVKMSGVQVGTVSHIELPTTPDNPEVEVQVSIDESYVARLREDSRARMRILLYLSGEKYVDVTPGAAESPELPPGSRIPLDEEKEIFQQGVDIAENLNEITISMRDILDSLQRGEGLFGQMLNDPEFGKEGLEALRGTLENTRRLTADLMLLRPDAFRGASTVGRLLYDPALAARLDQLGTAIEHFAAVVAAIDRREGAIGDLLRDDGVARQALGDLRDSAAAMKRVAARLDAGEGLVGRLLNDEAYAEAVAQDLRGALGDLRSVAQKLDSGQGSLGALINERTLHDGAEEVISGVNDSRFARWLIRHYQKKGIKATPPPAPEPAPPERP